MSFHHVFLSVNHVNTALQSVKCFTLGDIAAHLTAVNGIYVDVFLNSLLIKICDIRGLGIIQKILHELGILGSISHLMERLGLCVRLPSSEKIVRQESVFQIVFIRIVQIALEVIASALGIIVGSAEAILKSA